MCPYIKPGVGAVSTQSWVNPYLAIEALHLMEQGRSGPDALSEVLARDDAKELRQIGIVDAQGCAAAWSGQGCTLWFGHIIEPHFAVQGNMLVGEDTIEDMARAFRDHSDLDLAERLLLALEAGQAAGGDKRGRQSASLKVYATEEYALWDLRVDEHAYPVAELRRVYVIARQQLLPFIEGMPKKNAETGALPKSVSDMLLKPPPQRPGGGGSAP
jgi:uncharacterized Ntn-hydrolase superfamily protein